MFTEMQQTDTKKSMEIESLKSRLKDIVNIMKSKMKK